MKIFYTATATASEGGRQNGRTRTDDGKLDLQLSVPASMGGDGGDGTNPEQLFAAGYAACFASAVVTSAARDGNAGAAEGATVTARVDLGALGKGAFGLAVHLDVKLPGLAQDAAEELAALAHQRCPYSNATRGNIEVELNVEGSG